MTDHAYSEHTVDVSAFGDRHPQLRTTATCSCGWQMAVHHWAGEDHALADEWHYHVRESIARNSPTNV